MGHVRCGLHGLRCCWRCDRCPRCDPETGRLGRGDYCRDCVKAMKLKGYTWNEYSGDYRPPDVMLIGVQAVLP